MLSSVILPKMKGMEWGRHFPKEKPHRLLGQVKEFGQMKISLAP